MYAHNKTTKVLPVNSPAQNFHATYLATSLEINISKSFLYTINICIGTQPTTS